MLKKTSSFVLASLKASTYGKEYASTSRLLWPRFGKGCVLARLGWAGAKAVFLNILVGVITLPRLLWFYQFGEACSMKGLTPRKSGVHLVPFLLLTIMALTMVACLPPLEEQKTLIRKNDIRLRSLSSRAFIETWGPPAYEHREQTQFFVMEHGVYVPRFRVPLGEPPKGWTSEIVSGWGYFLAYPDRGELLGFLEEEAYVFEVLGLGRERMVYREHLSAQQIHKVGKEWEKEERFKTRLEEPEVPSGK